MDCKTARLLLAFCRPHSRDLDSGDALPWTILDSCAECAAAPTPNAPR